jgi:hypothetical protein
MAGASVAASRPVLVKPTDQTESLALARLSARKEPHTMNDMSEDTIEVLLFEDLDTIHRQDWAALQQSRLYARLNDPTLPSVTYASRQVPESSETPTDQ